MILKHIIAIAKKELSDYFSSLAAFLFLGIFLVASYITFFWVEAFFARNLADMRSFFDWVPILLIFLVSVLTMSSWSEERRLGTIELQITSAVSINHYILGKFFAIICLISIALFLTLPLAITVDVLGDMDWGPVVGGYLAAMFLAAAYVSIGLWASSQSDNQIVGLIVSVVVCSLFYIVGSGTLTQLFNYTIAEWLRLFSTSARFESITRGVLDMRDIFYYLTIVIIFLILNRIKIDSLRHTGNANSEYTVNRYRNFAFFVVTLVVLNVLFHHVKQLRVDFTEGQIYTLSSATKDYLDELDEPLLIRGYFSNSTHPLLSPLIPRMQDILNEYAVAGAGKVRIEMIDPLDQTSFEEEASVKYGIKPVSFHSETKYQASVINTYFNILIEYGGQFDVLDYKQLVELKSSAGKHDVELSNPEYLITRTIKSVVNKEKLQIDSLTDIEDLLVLSAYVSSEDKLPGEYSELFKNIKQVAEQMRIESNDNFELIPINPDEDNLAATYLSDKLKIKQKSASLNEQPFWFHFTLTDGSTNVPVVFDVDGKDTLSKKHIKYEILSAYKKMLPDSVQTIAILRPLPNPGPAGISASPGIPKRFSILRKQLAQSAKIIDVDLRNGKVNDNVSLLIVLAPQYLTPTQVNAIDAYYKQGGTVVVSTSTIDVAVGQFTEVYPMSSGLEGWLSKFGVSLSHTLVLDKQHGKYSLPVVRQAGSVNVRETNVVDYPYIIDVRGEGLNSENVISEKLGQMYMPWSSSISIKESVSDTMTITPLLTSSSESWLSTSEQVLPNFQRYPKIGFGIPEQFDNKQIVAAMFESNDSANSATQTKQPRLILVSSSMIFTDNFLDKMSQVLRTEYRRPMQFMQSIIDWSLEDKNLLKVLRKHTQFTRTLNTVSESDKSFWEHLNYILGVLGLAIVALINWMMRASSKRKNLKLLADIQDTN